MAAEADTELWGPYVGVKLVAFDFDKTITAKHTRGAIWIPDHLQKDVLLKNFVDHAFFKRLMEALKANGVLVCVATYADTEDGALASGGSLVRAYLDAALDGNSSQYIPDEHIEAWNPENRKMVSKKVGKNKHLEALCRRVAPKLKKSEVVLFDDTESNVLEAHARGYISQMVPPAVVNEETGAVTGGLTYALWREFLGAERVRPRGGDCQIM